jgi:peptidoglycan hydrolase CwlO-like protein
MRKYKRPSVNIFVTIISSLFILILVIFALVGINARKSDARYMKVAVERYKLEQRVWDLEYKLDSLQYQKDSLQKVINLSSAEGIQCNN